MTLIIPGFNDSNEELGDIAAFLAGISPDIPWHVTAFHKDYRMTDPDNTSVATLIGAAEIGKSAGLRYVYAGNLPGHVGRHGRIRRAPTATLLLIERHGFRVRQNQPPEWRLSQPVKPPFQEFGTSSIPAYCARSVAPGGNACSFFHRKTDTSIILTLDFNILNYESAPCSKIATSWFSELWRKKMTVRKDEWSWLLALLKELTQSYWDHISYPTIQLKSWIA